jgi:Tfp pilus assembly protein PilX
MIDMLHLNLKRRLTDQAGFVLPTAIIVLLIVTVLVGAAITVAAQTSTSTTRDDNTKAALEAAEAGLQVATYRLTKLAPEPTQCINGSEKTGVETECKSGSEPLGNGAEFTYWTTLELPLVSTCTGAAVTPPSNGDTYVQRCVTSVGKVNGVQRRVQERVFSLLASPLFEVEGILGYHSVIVKPNGTLAGEIGTNEIIKLENGVTVTKTDLGPSGTITGSGSPGTITKNTSPYVPPPIPIGQSAISAKTIAECGVPTLGTSAGKNCDFLITNGIEAAAKKTKIKPEDPVGGPSGSVTFNPSIRSLSMGNKAELTLENGIYNFCDFQVPGNGATLRIAFGATVQIFIDSAKREESGKSVCEGDPEAGKLVFKNGLAIENPNKTATSLQIYVYDNSGGTIEFKNNGSSNFYGTIVAPYSKVEIGNNTEFIGAIEANEVELINNFKFKWALEDKDLKAEIKPHYERKAWEECTPTYSGTNFQEGC